MVYKKGIHGPDAEHRGAAAIRIERKFGPSDEAQSLGPPPTVPGDSTEEDISNTTSSSREVQSETQFFQSESKDNTHSSGKTARTSYVEEPPSVSSTIDRKESKLEKQKSLVRRITNDMQIAQYVQKMDMINPPIVYGGQGVFTQAVYRIRSLTFMESTLRKMLWYLGKVVANHTFIFTMLPLLLFAISFVGPVVNQHNMFISLPFNQLFGHHDVVTNQMTSLNKVPEFTHDNPVFTALNTLDNNNFAVLMRTIKPKDSILRRDAVLAYSVLKKKIDDFPSGVHLELQERCPEECEVEKEMVDRIVKKSSQVALTYPETFVSMSKDSTNLSRVFLGSAIGGVETDTDGAISRGQAFLMTFHLRNDLSEVQRGQWLNNFEQQIEHTSASNISFTSWSPPAYFQQVIDTLTSTHKMLVFSVAIVVFFCIAASWGPNAYQTKPLVGIQMAVLLISVCLAGVFVQAALANVFNPLLWPVFFVVVGIGLLYCVHLHCSWSRFSFASIHPTEKLAFILAHDGPGIAISIVIVTVTFAFVGVMSINAHMQTSLVSLATSVAALLFFLFMFLAVFMYMGGRREAKGVKWYQCFKTGDTHFTAPNLCDFDTTSLFSLHDRLLYNKPNLARNFSSQLITSRMRYPLVFFCTAYLIFAAWGCANIKVELKEEHFVPSNSEPSKFIDDYRDMFEKTTHFMKINFEGSLAYHDENLQKSISEMLDMAVSEGYASRSVSWLSEFDKFQKNDIYDVNMDTFVPVVNLVFLATDPYRRFSGDVTFDHHKDHIIRSRMYLELTQKGIDDRRELTEKLLERAHQINVDMSVEMPFTMSLLHDMQTMTNVLHALGWMMVCLFVLSLGCFGQPALTFLLLFTSAAVIMETVGYSALWGIPLNVITFTMILAGNALTCVIVISFCYSYSVSGRGQQRAVSRIQYTYQATLVPVLFACLVPVISYLPLFLVGSPLVVHIWKVLLINSLASLVHYFFFLPNLMICLSERSPISCLSFSCYECCCDVDDDNSIYYIPTTGRVVHTTDGIYQASYAYNVPQAIHPAPPNYLAIGAPSVHSQYGTLNKGRRTRRERRNSESSVGEPPSSARIQRRRKHRSTSSRDDSIYEAPPSPRVASRSVSPRRNHHRVLPEVPRSAYYDPQMNWHPYVGQQPFVFYPPSTRQYSSRR